MMESQRLTEAYVDSLHVLIIGAGACGLMIAQGLKKNNISYAIYEKESIEGRVRDWGMAYHWSSDFIPQLLPQSIIEKLPLSEVDYGLTTPQGAPHEYVTARNTSTGEVLKRIPLRGGRRVSRKRFRQVLSNGIEIRYDKNVTNITYLASGVEVAFTDGTKASGSLVVGADGGGSRIRRLLLGKEAEPTVLPIMMNNFNVQYTTEQALFIRSKLAPYTDLGVHPKGIFYLMNLQNVPDPEDPSTWSFQMSTSWPMSLRPLSNEENTSEGRLQILRELTADHAEPRKSAVAWIPDQYPVPRDRLAIWSPIPWEHHNGRATLAGDAAHAMTYHRGQGLNNCINDAANLVTGLIEVKEGIRQLSDFMDRYQLEVVTRGAAEVEMSKQQSLMMHHWDQFTQSPVMTHGTAGINELKKKTAESIIASSVL